MFSSTSEKVRDAVKAAPFGIASLDVLESLKLCGKDTLKTTLSRLNKKGAIARLKRGAYAALPLTNGFAAALATFNGYLGFSSALYLHKLVSEQPFTIMVVTTSTSKTKTFGQYEFLAVALKDKAIGFEPMDSLYVSTRAKTLFDCLYLSKYAIEPDKLIEAFQEARLTKAEWREFDAYVARFSTGKAAERMRVVKKVIQGGKK